RWHGVLGSTGDILQGSSLAADPRLLAASSSSSSSSNAPVSCLALEIAGMKVGETATAAQKRGGDSGELRSSARRRRAAPPCGRRCVVALSGVASSGGGEECAAGGWRGEGRDRRGSAEGNDDEAYYSSLLDDCIKRVGAAKSADPPTFTPLRLQCSLKRRRGGDHGVGGGETSSSARNQHRQAGDSTSGGSGAGNQPAPLLQGAATLSLRAEMIAPALGMRLTPIAAPALLHTALYQSLLSRGAEEKLQSGFVTLNEGRRAVLLSDNDPLSLRAPIVGVWVSGGDRGGTSGVATPNRQQQQQSSQRRPSPLTHPYVYPACLRFLLGFRGCGGTSKAATTAAAAAAAAASPVAFLVLQLPGGVGGGTPACYEACAVSAGATPTAAGGGGLRVSSVGFEQLDFSADVDVSVGGGGREGGAAAAAGGGGASSTNRAVVIARLRRVSSLTTAGGAFGRALARARGRYRGTQQAENGATAPPYLPSPSATPTPLEPSPRQPPAPTHAIGATQRWHSRHHNQPPTPEDGENEGPTAMRQDRPLLHPPVPIAAPTKPVVHSPPSAASQDKVNSSPARATGLTSAINSPEKIISTSPTKLGSRGGSGPRASAPGGAGEGATRQGGGSGRQGPPERREDVWRSQGEEGLRELSLPSKEGGSSHRTAAVEGREASSPSPTLLPERGEGLPSSPAPVAAVAAAEWTPRSSLDLLALSPEAREYFLSQQRQLSCLAEQLHRLQVSMIDQQQQQQQQQQSHQPMRQQQQQQ
ncbi:unnamed protein product, partial [Ectocarpus fasciculatus]